MPLEAVLVVLDNSEYALNGDYGTTRWDSQLDSVKVLYNAKMNSNPENVLGVMTMAGKSPEVLASPTQNFGAIISAISDVKLQGEADLMTGINVAQLALKHRQNKNQRQRVIVFVGSPLEKTSSQELVKLGKKMKKNNVAVDIVSFGEDTENEEKLREFVEAVNSSDNSHLVSVPAGTVLLSDMILSSSMLAEDGVVPPGGAGGSGGGGGEAGGSGGDGNGDFGAVDPNLDPELAMALRMSLEEERARQSRSEQTQPAAAGASSSTLPTVQEGALAGESLATTTAGPSAETVATSLPPDLATNAAAGPPQASGSLNAQSSQATPAVGPTSSLSEAPAVKVEETEDSSMEETDENADLALALALSKGDGEGDVDMDEGAATLGSGGGNNNDEDEEMDEDEAIARAIAMSMKEEEQS